MVTNKPKAKLLNPFADTIETLREIGSDPAREIGKTVAQGIKTLGADSTHDFWSQISGHYEQDGKDAGSMSGEIPLGQEINIADLEKKHVAPDTAPAKPQHADVVQLPDKPRRLDVAPGLEYHRKFTADVLRYREQSMHKENQEVKYRVGQIQIELERIAKTSKIIEAQFAQLTIEETPEVGTYHINFFEWVLSVIQAARTKIEDSGSWMGALASKKGKRSYWAMFKKHGTSFGLSNERGVSTQTG